MAVCKNCGEITHFQKSAQGGRDAKQWCKPCYKTWQKSVQGRDTPPDIYESSAFHTGRQGLIGGKSPRQY